MHLPVEAGLSVRPDTPKFLFSMAPLPRERPEKLGRAAIAYAPASAILTPGRGFLSAYDFSLNPYSGCAFGCSYCYAAFFSRSPELRDTWGRWVTVKENALELLLKKKPGVLRDKTVYMSSVTDPYQPIEKKLELTRGLLEMLIARHQPRLVIQTRSPLAVRDIDLFRQFNHLQVNMTVTTDSEEVRRAFEPLCPANGRRLEAITEIAQSGIDACITLTPLLPVSDPEAFASALLATGVRKFVVQDFHATKGKFVAGTRDEALRISEQLGWTPARHKHVVEVLSRHLPSLGIGKSGFAPPER